MHILYDAQWRQRHIFNLKNWNYLFKWAINKDSVNKQLSGDYPRCAVLQNKYAICKVNTDSFICSKVYINIYLIKVANFISLVTLMIDR